MRYSIFKTILSGVLMTLALAGYSQIAEEIITEETPATQEQQKGVSSGSSIEAIDGVTRKTLMNDRMVLEYPHINEGDVRSEERRVGEEGRSRGMGAGW